ncbi:MAG TPA: PAS domain-containing protein [Stellaceae bacterium]|nr:PAS domain-containing protein [Stellaceae bacterium]
MSSTVTEPPATAHRKIIQLYEYWRKKIPGPGLLPGRRDIDPVDFGPLLPNVWLVDVVGEPPRFRFRLVGGAILKMGMPAKVGDFVDDFLQSTDKAQTMAEFEAAARERRPMWFRGPAKMPYETKMFELERIFLPLAGDGTRVDILLCMTVYYSLDGREI